MKTSIKSCKTSSIQIPIYVELLDQYSTYEDTALINQMLYMDRPLSIWDIKNLTLYDKSIRTLRKRLNSLVCRGILTRTIHPTLYNKSYYTANKNILMPTSNKLVTLIESKDMVHGDYHSAAVINHFRGLVSAEKDKETISVAEISSKLQMDISTTSIRRRIEVLERSGIFKRKLIGRVYEYELNSDLLLQNYTPELIDYASDKLADIFTIYLENKNKYIPKGLKESFSRLLENGYDFVSIKHIIAYLGIGKSDYTKSIFTVKNIKTHYEDLAYKSSKELSKRKANRYIYKLLNGLINFSNTVAVAIAPVVTANASLEHLLWFEVDKLVNSRIAPLKALYNKYSYNTGLDYEDLINECKLFLFKKSKNNNISPDQIKSTTIHGYIRQYCNSLRSNSSNVEIDNIDHLPALEFQNDLHSDIDNYDYDNVMDKVSDKFKDIPEKAMAIILDMLGADGIKLTQREASKKYSIPLSSFNNYIKPYFDAVKRIAGIDTDIKEHSSS